MQPIKLKKWGNSQGVRLPKTILNEAHIKTDDVLNVKVDKNKNIILEKKKSESKLAQRFEGFDTE